MGLFSDILEDCRDYGYIDPCSYISSPSRLNIFRDVIEREDTLQNHSTEYLEQRNYQAEYELYETIRSKCQVQEKNVLRLQNSLGISSSIMLEILSELNNTIEKNYIESNEAISNIQKQSSISLKNIHVDSEYEKNVLFETIMNNVYKTIISDVIVDNTAFRRLVYDSAKIISEKLNLGFNNNKKEIFKEYMIEHYHIKYSPNCCINCNNRLFLGIRYCINCFERC